MSTGEKVVGMLIVAAVATYGSLAVATLLA